MIYLGNNHVGFDQNELCYPAIAGCHGVGYVTSGGLFGFHNMGGADKDSWKLRSEGFANFVSGHPLGSSTGMALYGTCFATGGASRGYGGDKRLWLGELEAFAKALGFKGSIYGFDMGATPRPQPINVRYTRTGTKCVIQLKPYIPVEALKGPNVTPTDHKLMRRSPGPPPHTYITQKTELHVVKDIPNVGWQTVYPEQLR